MCEGSWIKRKEENEEEEQEEEEGVENQKKEGEKEEERQKERWQEEKKKDEEEVEEKKQKDVQICLSIIMDSYHQHSKLIHGHNFIQNNIKCSIPSVLTKPY